MRKYLLAAAAFCLTAFPLAAQDSSRLEIFGGFQYLRDGNADGFGDAISVPGWNASVAYYFHKHVGIAADISGNYRSTTISNASLGGAQQFPITFRAYTYTFGPVVSWNAGKSIKPFAHALFGEAHLRPNVCVIFSGSPDECGAGTYHGFTAMIGGGIDANSSGHLSYRIIQLDWAYLPSTGVSGSQSSNFRASTGLLIHF
jgi:hypothetical protein